MLARGTDILSSIISVVGRDSTNVAIIETTATLWTVDVQFNWKYPITEK